MLSNFKLTPTGSSTLYTVLAKTITVGAILGLFILVSIAYWLMVEVIQSGLVHTFYISKNSGYLLAIIFGGLPISSLLWRLIGQDSSYLDELHRHHQDSNKIDILENKKPIANSTCHIEHTPIYQNFKPRFQ